MATLDKTEFKYDTNNKWIEYTLHKNTENAQGIFAKLKNNKNIELAYYSQYIEKPDTYQLVWMDINFIDNKELDSDEVIKIYNFDKDNLNYSEFIIMAVEYYGFDKFTENYQIKDLSEKELKQELEKLNIKI